MHTTGNKVTNWEQYRDALAQFVPQRALEKAFAFLQQHAVHMKVTRHRDSKLGDYRMPSSKNNRHTISINGDLNQYMFLLVLIHEMAHLQTFIDYGRNVQPHGHQWQENYRLMLKEYHAMGCFPHEADALMLKYTASVPLPQREGKEIDYLLNNYGATAEKSNMLRLKELPLGSSFRIARKPQILFRSVDKRRTRYCCEDRDSGIRYLVSGETVVQPQDEA